MTHFHSHFSPLPSSYTQTLFSPSPQKSLFRKRKGGRGRRERYPVPARLELTPLSPPRRERPLGLLPPPFSLPPSNPPPSTSLPRHSFSRLLLRRHWMGGGWKGEGVRSWHLSITREGRTEDGGGGGGGGGGERRKSPLSLLRCGMMVIGGRREKKRERDRQRRKRLPHPSLLFSSDAAAF